MWVSVERGLLSITCSLGLGFLFLWGRVITRDSTQRVLANLGSFRKLRPRWEAFSKGPGPHPKHRRLLAAPGRRTIRP